MSLDERLLQSHLATGLREHRSGHPDAALAAYRQALAIAPDHPDALNLVGVALLELGQPDKAVDPLRQAARRQRDNAGILSNLAQAYTALGRHEDARDCYRKASRIDPREPAYQLGIAASLAMDGKLDDAETLLRRLLDRSPHAAPVWFNLGNVHRDRARMAEAIECYRRAIELEPDYADARNNLGRVLHAAKRFRDAEHEYRECVRRTPDYLYAHCNLASVLIDLGRFAEAETACRDVIAIAPGTSQAHTFLGAALGHQGRMLEALACYRAAANLAPRDPKIAETYASALTDSGMHGDGMRWFAHTLALDPDAQSAHQLLGTALLTQGRLAEGWVDYGHRPARLQFMQIHPGIPVTRHLPEDLAGQHICVVQEQGLGDEIFFLRYVPLLHAAGAQVTCRVSDKIASLLARAPGIGQILPQDAPLPEADAILLVGDLPHAMSAQRSSLLPQHLEQSNTAVIRDYAQRVSVYWPRVPPSLVLTPMAERLEEIQSRLATAGPPPYLGVTWRGGIPPQEQGGAHWVLYKEIAIAAFGSALRLFPGTVIALQRRPVAGELDAFTAALGKPVHDFTDLNEDLEGMLALLARIDDYVGVSNTNMHLRAGTGRTARVLVPCPPEWRWMSARRESPWFPGFTTYRQSLHGSWQHAFDTLASDLAAASWQHRETR